MGEEYGALVQALQQTSIPFAEYAWKTRPEGIYGVVTLDFESESLDGDQEKLDRTFSASIDVFFPELAQRENIVEEIESVLRGLCLTSWELNSNQYETETGLFHIEWVCEVM